MLVRVSGGEDGMRRASRSSLPLLKETERDGVKVGGRQEEGGKERKWEGGETGSDTDTVFSQPDTRCFALCSRGGWDTKPL